MADNAELEQLRARVAELERELDSARPAQQPAAAHHRWRSIFAAVLITLSCVLAPLSVVSVWANTQISNTDRYVATVQPLVHDPAIQSAIADQVTAAILTHVDVHALATDALNTIADRPNVPPRVAALLPGLAEPISNGIDGFIGKQVDRVVSGPRFAALWVQVNRVAHTSMVMLLEGNQGGVISAQGNDVTLNLAPIITEVKQRLVARGFSPASNIPTVDKSFVLLHSDAVTKAQGFYRLLNTLGVWLPIITLALLAAGIALAVRRRRALVAGALGIAGSMLLLGVALAVIRVLYLSAVPPDLLPPTAAGDAFDTMVRFLRYGLRTVALVGLIVALGAYLTGSGSAAVKTRSALSGGIGRLRGGAEHAGLNTGPVGTWTYAHRRWLRVGAVAIGAIVVVLWSQPNVALILTVTGLVLVALAIIEFLGRPPAAEAVPATGTALPRQPTVTERDAAQLEDEPTAGETEKKPQPAAPRH